MNLIIFIIGIVILIISYCTHSNFCKGYFKIRERVPLQKKSNQNVVYFSVDLFDSDAEEEIKLEFDIWFSVLEEYIEKAEKTITILDYIDHGKSIAVVNGSDSKAMIILKERYDLYFKRLEGIFFSSDKIVYKTDNPVNIESLIKFSKFNESQIPYIYALFNLSNDTDIIGSLKNIENSLFYSNLSENDKGPLFAGIAIGNASADYWYNYFGRHSEFGQSLWSKIKNYVKADIGGVLAGVGGALITGAITGNPVVLAGGLACCAASGTIGYALSQPTTPP